MQNKHQIFFLVVGVPTFGEGGGQAGWDKIPSLPKKKFGGLPLRVWSLESHNLYQNSEMAVTHSIYIVYNVHEKLWSESSISCVQMVERKVEIVLKLQKLKLQRNGFSLQWFMMVIKKKGWYWLWCWISRTCAYTQACRHVCIVPEHRGSWRRRRRSRIRTDWGEFHEKDASWHICL